MFGPPFSWQTDIDSATGAINIARYPFPNRRSISLQPADILEIIDWYPPTLKTGDGDLIMVSREHLATLRALATTYDIPFTQRLDLWSLILDPFLSSPFDEAHYKQTDQQLAEAGMTGQRVEKLRAVLKKRMTWLTAFTSEWYQCGLADALAVMKPVLPWKQKRWRAFYDEAIEIALRSPRLQDVPPKSDTD